MKGSEIAQTVFVSILVVIGAHVVGTKIGNILGRRIVTGEWRFSS